MRAAIRIPLALAGLLLLIACANQEDEGALRDRSLVPEPKDQLPESLDRDLLANYVEALTEMRRQEIPDDADIGEDLKRPAEMAHRMLFGPDALSVMREYGLEHAKLRRIRSWVLLAYGAVQFDAQRKQLEKDRERELGALEKLKGRWSEESYEEMRAQIEESVSSIEMLYSSVPAGHKQLVGRQIEVLEALLK